MHVSTFDNSFCARRYFRASWGPRPISWERRSTSLTRSPYGAIHENGSPTWNFNQDVSWAVAPVCCPIWPITYSRSIDLGKKIYAASFGPKNELILKLEKSNYLKIVENFEKILIFFTIFLILIFNLRFNYKIYLFSLVYLSSYSLLLFYINKD